MKNEKEQDERVVKFMGYVLFFTFMLTVIFSIFVKEKTIGIIEALLFIGECVFFGLVFITDAIQNKDKIK